MRILQLSLRGIHYTIKVLWPIVIGVTLAGVLTHHTQKSSEIVKGWYAQKFKNNSSAMFRWIRAFTPTDAVILTDWVNGQVVAANTGRRVIATSKVIPSESGMVAERYNDIAGFFCSESEQEALYYVRKYRLNYVLAYKFRYDRVKPRYDREKRELLFKGKNLSGYGLRHSIIGKMVSRSKLKYFKKVQENSSCVLYEVLL